MITLQQALDKIGFTGTASASFSDLETITYKFSKKCPMSTIHVNGTLKSIDAANEAEVMDRVITQGMGGICIELGIVFKWMIDQIGFTSRFVEIEAENGSWDERLGVIVDIDNEEWFCAFGFHKVKLCKPVKVETEYSRGQVEVEYDSGSYCVRNTFNNACIKFKTIGRDIQYWNDSCETYSVSGRVVDKDVISVCIDEYSSRLYYSNKIVEMNNDSSDWYIYKGESLIELFNYNGTI